MSKSPKEIQADIVTQIKAEMGANGWNQADLAAKAGMATSTLSRYLAGTRDMPLPAFAEISRALDLSIAELVERSERRQEASTP